MKLSCYFNMQYQYNGALPVGIIMPTSVVGHDLEDVLKKTKAYLKAKGVDHVVSVTGATPSGQWYLL